MIWNEEFECMDLADLKNIQSERLARIVSYVYANCPSYRRKFDNAGIAPDEIRTIDDIVKLPFTTKEDLRDSYPFGMFSVDPKSLAAIHVSSGTTGNPTVVGYTKDDIDLWSDVVARALCCAGARPGDRIQNAYGYGLFTGGLGLHYGAMKMGLTVIPVSAGQTRRQLKIMQDLQPRIISCTPSYALYIAEEAREMGLDPRQSSWKIGIFGAEPWSEAMRTDIENELDLLATDIYGLSEIIGPGVSQECTHKDGLHIFSDVFFPELIDPINDQPAPPGADGELVITTLTKQAIPLIRYRTRDIVSMNSLPCRCGRTSPRLSKIKGRTDDMIVVRGINVFPSQIEHVLFGIEGVGHCYQIVVDRRSHGLDEVEVLVEVEEDIFSDEVKVLRELQTKIKARIDSVLSIGVKVTLVEPKKIERSMGKAKRLIDKRTLR